MRNKDTVCVIVEIPFDQMLPEDSEADEDASTSSNQLSPDSMIGSFALLHVSRTLEQRKRERLLKEWAVSTNRHLEAERTSDETTIYPSSSDTDESKRILNRRANTVPKALKQLVEIKTKRVRRNVQDKETQTDSVPTDTSEERTLLEDESLSPGHDGKDKTQKFWQRRRRVVFSRIIRKLRSGCAAEDSDEGYHADASTTCSCGTEADPMNSI